MLVLADLGLLHRVRSITLLVVIASTVAGLVIFALFAAIGAAILEAVDQVAGLIGFAGRLGPRRTAQDSDRHTHGCIRY